MRTASSPTASAATSASESPVLAADSGSLPWRDGAATDTPSSSAPHSHTGDPTSTSPSNTANTAIGASMDSDTHTFTPTDKHAEDDDTAARLRQLGLADEPDPHLRLLNSASCSSSECPTLLPLEPSDSQPSSATASATGGLPPPLHSASSAGAGVLTPAAFGAGKTHTSRARSGTAVSNMSTVSDMTAISTATTVAARTAAADGLVSLPLPLRRSSQNVSAAHGLSRGHTSRTSISRPSTSESYESTPFAHASRASPLVHSDGSAEVFAPGTFARGPRGDSRTFPMMQAEPSRAGAFRPTRSAGSLPALTPRGRASTVSEDILDETTLLSSDNVVSPSPPESSALSASGLSAAGLSLYSGSGASVDRMAKHERSFDTLGTGAGSLSSPSFSGSNTFATSEASLGSGHLSPRDLSRRETRGAASALGKGEARSPPKANGLKARSVLTPVIPDSVAHGKQEASESHEQTAVPPVVDFSHLAPPRGLEDELALDEAMASYGTGLSPVARALSLEEEASTSPTSSNLLAVQRARQVARTLPNGHAMAEASRAVVYKENGTPIKFIELCANHKTIVVFTSHWACPHFQQYVKKLCNVNMAALGKAGYSLILVGQGSVQHMAAFQHSFPVPFSLYADVDRAVYRALGMHLANPALSAYDEYLHALAPRRQAKKTGSKTGLRKGLLHLPLAASGAGGSGRHVLGGVFVLGPGSKCGFAHRLTATNEYPDVEALLSGLGIGKPMLPLRQQIDPVDRAKAELEVTDYWSPETPYYNNNSNKSPPPSGSGGMGAQSFAPTTVKPERQGGGLLQESKQRLSLFLGRAKPTGSIAHAPLPSLGLQNRRPVAPFESMQNFSEPMHNPDPFAVQGGKGEDGLSALPTGADARPAPWRVGSDLVQRHRLQHSDHTGNTSAEHTLTHSGSIIGPGTESHRTGGVSQFLAAREKQGLHPTKGPGGRPGKISVRQLTTAAMHPMETEP